MTPRPKITGAVSGTSCVARDFCDKNNNRSDSCCCVMSSLPDIVLLLCLLPFLAECGPWCFKCDDAFHPAVCQEVIACGQHENCYAEKHSNNNGAETFSSGCKPIGDCSVVKRSAVHCSECCTSTLCNEVLCASSSISNKTRLWCADCSLQSDPSACDHVDLCSQDQACSVTKKTVFGFTTYDLGCEDKQQCQGKTLAVDQQQCCDSHLCNTNLAGVSPDLFTSPPPSTTTPTPAAATATINETDIDYVSHHLGNETLQITCLISGFPTPNVTWFFTPHSTGSANTTGSGNTTGNTGTAVSGTVATGNNSLVTNVTTGNNSTTGGNSTIASNSTAVLNSTVSNAQGGVTSVQITSGVTTNGNVSVLEITSPDSGDAGEYTCHVENQLGPFETAVTVTYAEVPVISGASNMTLQGDARDDVIMDCDVDGSPTPDLVWQVPPGAGGVERLSNGSLLLHNVHADTAGDYVCLANNTVGTAVKTFSLSVLDNSTAPCPTAAVLITTLPPPATTSTTSTTSTIPSTTTDQTTVTTPPPTPVTCPTLPPTTTPQSTPTTSSPASSTPSSTLTTSTPTTTTISTPSTTTAATTSETTTTATSPSTTSTTATTLSTTTSSTPTTTTTTMTTGPPMVHAVGSLFQSSDGGYVVLQCAVPLSPGVTSSPPVTWSRLASDYDHSDTKSYTENGHGVLVIAPQPHSVTTDGVYVCHVAMGSPNDKAEFVVYKDVPGPIDCRQEFNVGNPSVGMVLRTTCGPCQLAPLQTSRLIWRDQICNSAVGRGVIPQSGGTVTWLLKANNEVDLLKEQNGHVMHTT